MPLEWKNCPVCRMRVPVRAGQLGEHATGGKVCSASGSYVATRVTPAAAPAAISLERVIGTALGVFVAELVKKKQRRRKRRRRQLAE